MAFRSWPKQLFQAYERLRSPNEKTPTEGSKEYWMQRCALAESALYQQQNAGDAGYDLFSLSSVNQRVDDMKEYRNLLQVDVANTQCYERGLSTGRRQHAPLAKFFQMLIANKTDPRANAKRRRQSAEATELAVENYKHARAVALDGIIAQLQRLRSKDNAPLWTVVRSIVALRQGLKKSYWEAESAQRLLMSKTWTLGFVLEMTARGIEEPFPIADDISFCVYDNCDYHRTKAFQRADDEGEYIKTVSIVHLPLEKRLYTVSPQELGECMRCFCCPPLPAPQPQLVTDHFVL